MTSIKDAVTILRQGGLVGVPTETVYGLGADAQNEAALRKIFIAKQRPIDHPLIVHLAADAPLSDWAIDISPHVYSLAQVFWPGPLTLILKKSSRVSGLLTGQQPTVGIRIPRHPVAQALLQAFDGGIAAPSANRFGRISPTTAAAVREELGAAVDLILEGGQCSVGVESTIVDMTRDYPIILRPGIISAEDISGVLASPVRIGSADGPRVSGSHHSHYAPQTPTRALSTEQLLQWASEQQTMDKLSAVLGHSMQSLTAKGADLIKMPTQPQDYAHDLYHVLRETDKKNYHQIIIEAVPETMDWWVIRDRLQRACAQK